MTDPRLLLCGGGTGGHVAPGVAVVEALRARAPGASVLFAGTGRPVERRILDAAGIEGTVLPASAAPRLRRPWTLPRFLRTTWNAIRTARRLLAEHDPDVVIALGGYGCVAPALAARVAGVPLVVLEQNAVPGRAVKMLARFADAVHVPPVEGIERAFPVRAALVATGNPIRRAARLAHPGEGPAGLAERRDARRILGLPEHPDARVLLAIGGSQGALRLNRYLVGAAETIAAAVRAATGRDDGFALLHLTGSEAEANACREAYRGRGVRAVVRAFLDRPALAYAACDLAFTRGGAGVLAELAAAGRPAVVVPLPSSARDHQHANGVAHAACGAGILAREVELGGATARRIGAWLGGRAALLAGGRAARAIGRPEAADEVARQVIELSERARRARTCAGAPSTRSSEQEGSVRWGTVRGSA